MSAEMEKKMGDEKLRISRELHDNIGSQLTFVISSLDNIIYVEKNNPFTEKLKSLALSGRETLEDLRNTIWAIRKKEGDLSQIIYKINDLIYKMNLMTPTISFNNQTDQEYNLTSTQLLNSYRIIQEAIQNALKHSEASEIIIEFKSGIDELIITIKDNGKGFDVNEIYEGSGLDNIRHRCNEASGQSKIESGPGGTLITCAFKVK
jgi:signal transduction histidine kinase